MVDGLAEQRGARLDDVGKALLASWPVDDLGGTDRLIDDPARHLTTTVNPVSEFFASHCSAAASTPPARRRRSGPSGSANGLGACTPGQLVSRPPCDGDLVIEAVGGLPARVMLLGGAPFDEHIIVWWNFVGRTHEDIVGFRTQWQAERAGGTDGTGRFGRFPDAWDSTLPAPELPNSRLKPRR